MGRKSLVKLGKASLSLFAISAVVYLIAQFNLFGIVSGTIDTTQAGGKNTVTFVNTSIAPDKWTANGTSEWYNFTVTLSDGNATEVVITVPSSVVTTTANFSVDNVTNVPHTNASGIWTITYPENYSANGLPKMINFSVAPASAFMQSARFDIYATANISDVADSVLNMWNITVRDNETLTYNMTYLNVTADTKIPVIKNPTPANASYIYGTITQLFQINVTDNNANRANVTLYWRSCAGDWPTCGGAGYTSYILECFNTSVANTTFICNRTVDSSEGEGWNISYYFETSDNVTNYASNGTSASSLVTTIDRTVPNPSNIIAKYDVGTKYDNTLSYGFQIDWTDAVAGVSNATFESNITASGGRENTSAYLRAGTNTWFVNFTQAQFPNASNYTYRWFANDTTNVNWNISNTTDYWVRMADNPTYMLLNGSVDSMSVVYNTSVNITGYVTSGGGSLYRNISGTWANVSDGKTPDENNTVVKLGTGVHGFTMNATGTANYTANDTVPLYTVTVSQGAANVTLTLNGTLSNTTIGRNSAVNVALTSNVTEGWVWLYNTSAGYAVDIMNQSTVTPLTAGALNITNITVWDGTAGTEYNITAYYNGSQNYTASGLATWWIKIDSTPPTYSDMYSNVSNLSVWGKYEGIIGIGASWNDNVNVSFMWNATNASGGGLWVNGTRSQGFTLGPANASNFTIDMSTVDVSGGNAIVQAKIYVNDTSNNSNVTGIWQWTIDGTVPVFNTTTPANNSFINGSSNQLFQIHGYDDSLNYSNVSIYRRYCGPAPITCGAWQVAVGLTCYNTTTSNDTFICNTTSIDLSLRGEGVTVQYYFEGTDYSSKYGNNGSSTVPLNATIDRSAPTYANNNTNLTAANDVAALDAYVLIYANWTDATALDYAVLQTNESGVWRNYTDGTFYGSPYNINLTTGKTWSNFTWRNISLRAGDVVLWRIFANDTVGHENATANGTYFTIDSTKPYPRIWESNVTNGSTVFKGAGINVSAEWVDNTKLDKWWLYYSDTDSAVNRSYATFAATNNSNSSFIINTSNFTVGATFNVSFYANDTSGNQNASEVWWFTIDGTKPTIALGFDIESNFTNISTIGKNARIRVSANWTDDIGLSHYWVWYNYSGSVAGTNATAEAFSSANRSNATAIVNASSMNAGDTFQIKFYANDTSNNTNVTGLLSFTIDSTAPMYTDNGTNVTSGNTIFKGAAIYIYANWTDNVNLSQGWVEQNFTTGAALENVSTSFAPANWTNYTLTTSSSSLIAGNTYVARLFANDTSGVENFTVPTWSWTIDDTAPTIENLTNSSPDPSVYSPGISYRFNVTVSDALNVSNVFFDWNGTINYTTTLVGPCDAGGSTNCFNYSYTFNDLPKSNNTYRWWANDTSNNSAASATGTFNVTQNTSTSSFMNLTINSTTNVPTEANRTVTYAEAVNVTGNISKVNAFSGQTITFTLYRNDGTTQTPVGTSSVKEEILLGNGTYNYTYITAGNANYTSATKTFYVFVNKGDTSCGISPATQTITYEASITPYCYSNATEVQCTLWKSDTNVTLTENDTGAIVYGADNSPYIFIANNTQTENYTACTAATFTLTVTKKAFTFGMSPTTQAITYNALVNQNVTSNDTIAASKMTLWRNTANITGLNNTNEALAYGIWTFVANSTHPTGNYSWSEQAATVTVSKANPTNNMTLTLDGSTASTQTRDYSNQTNITATKNATGDSDCIWTLIRNGTNIGAAENKTAFQLNASGWNYTYYAASCTNYTNGQIEIFVNMQKRPTNMSLWIANTSYPENVQGNRETELGVDVNFTAVLTNATYPVWLNITANISAAQGWVNQTRLSANSNISNITETAGFSVGRYNITAHFDGDENHTASSVTYYLNITDDVTAPSVRIYDNVLAGYRLNNDTARASGLTMSVNVSVSDTGVGMAGKSCIAIIGDSSAGSQAYSGGWCNMTLTVPSGLSNGANLLNITINDTNFNTGVNDTYYITVDNTAPVLTITFPAANGTYNKSDSSAGKYIWINGTVSDNLQMGMLNVSINGTYFNDTPTTAKPLSFTGANGGAFAYRNMSAIPDGYYLFVINYTDNATNVGNVSVNFTVDNTPPSAVYGLTNSSSQTYGTTASQTMEVQVVDTWQTNRTITLNYYINSSWQTALLTGTPSTSTTYSGSISTIGDDYKVDSAGRAYIPYYVTGIDNATNPMSSNNGSATSPLANLTLGTTGAIDGYIKTNDTTPVHISGATVSINATGVSATYSGANGYYYISSMPAGDYAVSVNATNYISNSTTITVTAGATSRANVTIASNATGTINGYITLTNTTAVPNSTSLLSVSDVTRTVGVNTAGLYQITGVPAGAYTITVSGSGYWTNTTSVTIGVGATVQANIKVTGAESFNVTIPGSSTSSATVGTNGFLDSGWHAFLFRADTLSNGTTNHTIEYLFSSIGQGTSYNYSSVWRYNSTSESWASFIPKQTNTWVNITSGNEQYYVRANATDRVEIEPRYT
jgi:hypothetical protein